MSSLSLPSALPGKLLSRGLGQQPGKQETGVCNCRIVFYVVVFVFIMIQKGAMLQGVCIEIQFSLVSPRFYRFFAGLSWVLKTQSRPFRSFRSFSGVLPRFCAGSVRVCKVFLNWIKWSSQRETPSKPNRTRKRLGKDLLATQKRLQQIFKIFKIPGFLEVFQKLPLV